MSDGGKGSSRRPMQVSNEEYASRWDAIFARDDTKYEKKPPPWLHECLNEPPREDADGPIDREIKGVRLIRTCYACPQQYDAFLDGKQVGYLRLRHGRFTVESPDVGGTLVYSGYPNGDGIFDSDEEEFFLTEAVDSILAYLAK